MMRYQNEPGQSGGLGVPSSNLGAPTKFLNRVRGQNSAPEARTSPVCKAFAVLFADGSAISWKSTTESNVANHLREGRFPRKGQIRLDQQERTMKWKAHCWRCGRWAVLKCIERVGWLCAPCRKAALIALRRSAT